jgi:flagellar L-ring protein precursor FlgH
MNRRVAVIDLLFLLVVLAGPAAAESLYREGATGVTLFADLRARAVNDLVTILIVEQSSSSRTADTKSSKSSSRTAGVTAWPQLLGGSGLQKIIQDQLNMNMQGEASHQGKGSIDRTDNVTGQIAARVVKVLDNGNLVVEGRRAVLVNDETQVITISGVVRPQDVTQQNTVLSSQIAEAEVQMVGRGVLAEAQRPGILYRLLDWLRLF